MAVAASAAMSGSRWTRLPLVGNLGYPIALKEVRSLIRGGRYFWAQFFYLAVLAVGDSGAGRESTGQDEFHVL